MFNLRRCLLSVAAVATCFIVTAFSGAQTMQNFKFSVQSQLVEVYLTVTNGKQLVPHLKASDFKVTEDGTPVSIDRLDNQDVPLQIVLMCDLSESIKESLKAIQDSATAFVESMNPDDRVTLILFNSEIRVFPQKTDDRKPILNEIRNAQAGGMTKLYDSLLMGMKYLDGKPGRKAIVCLTDGQDTSGTSSRIAVLNAAARYGYPIYTIGAGAGLELSSLKIILREFAEVNSGRALFIENIRKLREAFAEIQAELRSAYVLNYYTHIPSDGRWHDLNVTTVDPALEVHSRRGFFATTRAATNPLEDKAPPAEQKNP
jgi:Ca-activated chloride channel family protein